MGWYTLTVQPMVVAISGAPNLAFYMGYLLLETNDLQPHELFIFCRQLLGIHQDVKWSSSLSGSRKLGFERLNFVALRPEQRVDSI